MLKFYKQGLLVILSLYSTLYFQWVRSVELTLLSVNDARNVEIKDEKLEKLDHQVTYGLLMLRCQDYIM